MLQKDLEEVKTSELYVILLLEVDLDTIYKIILNMKFLINLK